MQQQSTHAFSIRQLNPFRGVLQVFHTDKARALSGNGRVWEIQVLSDKPSGLWANTPYDERQFYSFGLWSAAEGLSRVPVNPLFNVRDMIASAETLTEGLRPALERLPFPLADPFEAWLLDERESAPLALLQTARSDVERRRIKLPKWIAAERGDFSFVSRHLLDRGLPNRHEDNPRVHASLLETLVRNRAGRHRRAVWYYRQTDGRLSPCTEPAADLDAGFFPELPLSENWPETEASELVGDYISWRAPQLLTLPSLGRATRERLERLAVEQAEAVERLWRLYPEIHNRDLLNQARVRAKIRTANRN